MFYCFVTFTNSFYLLLLLSPLDVAVLPPSGDHVICVNTEVCRVFQNKAPQVAAASQAKGKLRCNAQAHLRFLFCMLKLSTRVACCV